MPPMPSFRPNDLKVVIAEIWYKERCRWTFLLLAGPPDAAHADALSRLHSWAPSEINQSSIVE